MTTIPDVLAAWHPGTLPGGDAEPTSRRYCLADETWWLRGELCVICGQPGQLGSTPPAGWPVLCAADLEAT